MKNLTFNVHTISNSYTKENDSKLHPAKAAKYVKCLEPVAAFLTAFLIELSLFPFAMLALVVNGENRI